MASRHHVSKRSYICYKEDFRWSNEYILKIFGCDHAYLKQESREKRRTRKVYEDDNNIIEDQEKNVL